MKIKYVSYNMGHIICVIKYEYLPDDSLGLVYQCNTQYVFSYLKNRQSDTHIFLDTCHNSTLSSSFRYGLPNMWQIRQNQQELGLGRLIHLEFFQLYTELMSS